MASARGTPGLYLLAAAIGCASPADWPVCGNEQELTAAQYAIEGDVPDSDFLVCGALPEDGSPCPDYRDVDADAFFTENVGDPFGADYGYTFRSDCGPETTRDDACCYVLEVEAEWGR